ncbi:MAG: hypothetical protein QNJ63_13925 [Calothrix sp. MO_192.B10]|nr:hypothetical protein [Calothrix sp. MO_192.B10]
MAIGLKQAFDIDNDLKLDIVGYGLGLGEVNWYQNPNWHCPQVLAKKSNSNAKKPCRTN